MRPRDAGDERISTRFKCPHSPVSSAFIVFLDIQLFVGGLASSSLQLRCQGGSGLSDVGGLQLVYIYGRHITFG